MREATQVLEVFCKELNKQSKNNDPVITFVRLGNKEFEIKAVISEAGTILIVIEEEI